MKALFHPLGQKKNHWIILFFFVTNVLISHIFLSLFNEGEDFLLFSRWSLFSSSARQSVKDITWDQGQSYLFRDHRSALLRMNVDIHTLFYLLGKERYEIIKEKYILEIKAYCQCSNIEFHELSGSLFEHILMKKDLEIISSSPL